MTTTGRLVAKPKKATGGDLSFVLERDGASSVKVMADVSSRIEALSVGATYRVIGVVGQRATRSGALGWLSIGSGKRWTSSSLQRPRLPAPRRAPAPRRLAAGRPRPSPSRGH